MIDEVKAIFLGRTEEHRLRRPRGLPRQPTAAALALP